MAEPEAAVEREEQVDLEGDNDSEDMMDDDDAAVEECAYRKVNKESPVEEEEREHRSGGEEPEMASPSDGGDDAALDQMKEGEEKQEERPEVGSRDGADSQKWAELLALPPHGLEVFFGGLPRHATEEDLRELCKDFGEILDVRPAKEKDKGEFKGCAFITFTTKDAAQKAIDGLHGKEFKGRTLRCSLSQAKRRLFIGNVPKSLSEEELRKILEESGPGVQNIENFKDPQNPSRNGGFLFVEYYNHACADYARQKMSSPNFKMDGSNPTVRWAVTKDPAGSSSAAQVKVLYLKNLPENVTPEKLKDLFECHGEVTKVVLPRAKAGRKQDFGFIHFAERSSALKAVNETEKYEIDGHVVDVSLAKPQLDKKSDHALDSFRPRLPSYPPYPRLPSYPPYPAYGYTGHPYGAGGFGQPVIHGRGPVPDGMRVVPMTLPDGRLGYVLRQPGAQTSPPPSSSRRSDRSGGSGEGGGRRSHGEGGGRRSHGNHRHRHRPY